MSVEGGRPAREQISELALAEWRREVFDIYREVRLDRDPERAHTRWRERRDRLFREHSESPLAVDDPLRQTGIPYWPYDAGLRFSVEVHKAVRPVRRSLPTGGEDVTELRQVGWVELPGALGARLAVWWLAQYGGGLFVPFRDRTAGSESYGAGRYLLDTAKGADLGLDDGRLVVDFNFSYHPSCRYDAAWQCPLAPPENVLGGAVRAGERL
jgi:uncharacterized protein (DUF1684 family)